MRYPSNEEVEALLKQETRAALPFARLLRIYLDPFFLFKDASRGSPWAREAALRYNRARRWMLLRYIRRWIAIGLLFFASIDPVQARAAENVVYIIPAVALAAGFAIAIVVIACAACCYLFLGAER